MDYINRLEKCLGDKYDCLVKISDDLHNPDLELSEWYTADDYNVHVMTNDARNVDWENDVYYYEPSFTTIMERIEETVDDVGYGGEVKIYIDTEQYLPEGDVLNWVDEKNEEAFQNGD